jgi:hypothetical protein
MSSFSYERWLGSACVGVPTARLQAVAYYITCSCYTVVIVCFYCGRFPQVYLSTRGHLNSAFPKFLPSVIPTLQPLKFLRRNLNSAWTHVSVFMKLHMCHMKPSPGALYKSHSSAIPIHCILSNCSDNKLYTTWMLESNVIKNFIHIMPPEANSTAWLINPSRQWHQHNRHSNCRIKYTICNGRRLVPPRISGFNRLLSSWPQF